jgi:maleate isomerase
MPHRVGLIVPSSNRMVEEQMVKHYPEGVVLHVNRLRMTGEQKVPLAKLGPRITEATAALVDARCNVVTFHCTANSTDEGTEGERLILDAMRKGGAERASTTATAIRRALEALDAKSMVLVTPYSQAVTDHESEFFRAIGIDVLTAKGHNLGHSDKYCAAPPSYWRDSALAARHPNADLYFLSCANIDAIGVVDELERELGKPVITSNQAVLWDQIAGRGLGLPASARKTCPGRLLAYA